MGKCNACETEKKWKECSRCEGRGGWFQYDPEFRDPEWEECPDCNGDEGTWVCPQWAIGLHTQGEADESK